MDYLTQIEELEIGEEYILSPDADIRWFEGGYHRFTESLKTRFHILLDKMPLHSPGKYLLIFNKVTPVERLSADPPRFDTRFINHEGGVKLFLKRDEFTRRAAKETIQRALGRFSAKRKTLKELYAPGGPGYNKAKANWNNQTAGRRKMRKRKTLRKRRT